MAIDLETLMRTASLARLDPAYGLEPGEAEAALEVLQEELGAIVGYMDVLGEAETDGVEPLYSPMLEAPGTREDLAADSAIAGELLDQAPDRIGGFFAVPKIL